MCNLYNLKVDPRGYFDALAAVDDAANVLGIEKDYAAPASPAMSCATRMAGGC